jgi:hypothetical protein
VENVKPTLVIQLLAVCSMGNASAQTVAIATPSDARPGRRPPLRFPRSPCGPTLRSENGKASMTSPAVSPGAMSRTRGHRSWALTQVLETPVGAFSPPEETRWPDENVQRYQPGTIPKDHVINEQIAHFGGAPHRTTAQNPAVPAPGQGGPPCSRWHAACSLQEQ